MVAAGVLTAARADAVIARWPALSDFLRLNNLALLMMALAGVKVLHELGHALACKRFGGECHEIGLMLLVFTPCLYCDVSDSWTFSRRWRRGAVAAAGVYVELVLASLAVFLWWFSRPGLLQAMCLNVIVVCSVGTMIFNANPLLRYDGYYLLSDALGVPNLRQRSRAILRRGLARWCLGWVGPDAYQLPRRRLLLGSYAVASIAYTWLVMVTILWFLHRTLRPQGWGAAATILAAVVVGRFLFEPVHWAARVVSTGTPAQKVSRSRVAGTAAVLTVALTLLFWFPLPQRVSAPAVLLPVRAQPAYVTVPGLWEPQAASGDKVAKGQLLGRLVNDEVAMEVIQLEGQVRQLRRRLEHLNTERHDPAPAIAAEAAASLPMIREALADAENRWRQRLEDQRRLMVTAPCAGTVIPPPRRLAGTNAESNSESSLPFWRGTPLDSENSRSYLDVGSLLCFVGDAGELEALVEIPHPDVGLVQTGQRVRLKLDAAPDRVFEGTVVQLASSDQTFLAGASRDDLWRPTKHLTPAEVAPPPYQARIAVDDAPIGALVGARGHAQIVVARQSLGARLRRFLTRTFRFSH